MEKIKTKTCFVISPIGEEGSETRKRADQLFKYIINPVCDTCDFNAVRVDQMNQADSITQTIIDHLKTDALVIADITGHNPNAFYEMGFRASTNKPIIHLKEKGESIPFDIAGIRAFEYDLKDLDSVDEIKVRLEQTINAFDIVSDNESKSEDGSVDSTEKDTSSEKGHIFQILYSIQDQIESLRDDIRNKDTETIQAIVKASQPAPVIEDQETALMKTLLPELIKNPNSIKTLLELSNMQNGKK